tara:strand:+ start:336 stop:875 length:540 start_codon:yes stop_codon:yes gene_type:complete
MNYSEKNPTVAFRIEKKLFQKLEREAIQKKITNSEISREIITKYLKLELIENNQTEYDKLKLEKLKEEIRYLKIKNDFAENFDKPISNSATRYLKPKPELIHNKDSVLVDGSFQQSPYDADNKRLQCTDCGILITWDSFDSYLNQIKEYKQHILSRHNREFTPLEKNVIDNLKYEGKSK